ncbi:hypothetical protein K458DRAFT_389081 [Lentithecium fluviatile CBS 122367]|uniref:Heterokaryon incompatibility domain-containing protein n=1 Tax=Lentithecium fluviatile CBS 122367 TaxID=1168545 RepID=A0A6G1J332_9PLEO|nr:hypothetical protein K458DRAFT_389081 [Lentithecium fluviatile CBS 122367]
MPSVGIGCEQSNTLQYQADMMLSKELMVDRVSTCAHLPEGIRFESGLYSTLPVLRDMLYKRNSIHPTIPGSSHNKRRLDGNYAGKPSCSLYDAWLRVLCVDVYSEFNNDGSYVFRRNTINSVFAALEELRINDDERRGIYRMVKMITKSSSMFLTEKGYLGIAKEDDISITGLNNDGLHVGDSIFVLAHGILPFVLRETEDSKSIGRELKDKTLKVFGPCYVHGFMNGEHDDEL